MLGACTAQAMNANLRSACGLAGTWVARAGVQACQWGMCTCGGPYTPQQLTTGGRCRSPARLHPRLSRDV